MTGFDYAVMTVAGISLVLGIWRGFVREVMSLAAWALAFWAASEFGHAGAVAVSRVFMDPLVQTVLGYALVFVGVLLFCSGLIALVRMLITAAGLGLTDRVLGGVFGLTRGVFITLLAVLVCGLTDLPKNPWWQDAKLAPPLETAVLATKPWLPEGLASKIRYPLR
ncbi:MAG: hypothetical protein RIR70_1859 [Pseudomonadota bacterium]